MKTEPVGPGRKGMPLERLKTSGLMSNKKATAYLFTVLALGLIFWFILPRNMFDDPVSTVIFDHNGELLGAQIAADGQWRFPANMEIPCKVEKALLNFEDRYFYIHPGVNPLSLIRAFLQNLRSGRVVSGGSTLSMQVIRMHRKGKPRNLSEKFIETILALRLELGMQKKEILSLYISNAPFGGNVVGLDAASWRYFGRTPGELSWGEAAVLAVLPNSPSLIYPGRNQELLREKRNRLLECLFRRGLMDSLDCFMAKLEPLPGKPLPLPRLARHAMQHVINIPAAGHGQTTLHAGLQNRAVALVHSHSRWLEANNIHNIAVLIMEVNTGNVLVYVGNTDASGEGEHGNEVDVIMAPRSPGSLLKPALFAAMLEEGQILPGTLVPDIPVLMDGYSPKNFSLTYDGAVSARRALARSLNVPAVRMLQEYGVEKFIHVCKKMGMGTLGYSADHYGLSLILGGAEGRLWELCGMFASMARILNHFGETGHYFEGDIHPPFLICNEYAENQYRKILPEQELFGAATLWTIFESLVEVNRPETEEGWMHFSSSRRIAWKTGTSFGYRDAWAIGTCPEFVVGVWAGNADGEGRPGLTGIASAAPLMFKLFDLLPPTGWFARPLGELFPAVVCRMSGHLAGQYCEPVDTIMVGKRGLETPVCPYHRRIHLDMTETFRVTSDCEQLSNMTHRNWFVLPPVQEWYYSKRHPGYQPLPSYRPDCADPRLVSPMAFIYPGEEARVFVPLELDGSRGRVVFEATHREPGAVIYWHLDSLYIGLTREIHQVGLTPPAGKHRLTLVDQQGNISRTSFHVFNE